MAKRHRVNIETALNRLVSSELFSQQLKSGRYIYAERRICLNQPKYIQWDGTMASLTAYAREHQDECCLLLSDYPKKKCDQRVAFTSRSKCRVALRCRCFKMRAYNKPAHNRVAHFQRLTKSIDTVTVLTESLPNNFSQMLDKLIESKGVTEEDLAESSRLSVKTIQRLRNHEPKSVTLETVLQLCIGLHLHPILSEYLLRAAGQRFMDTKLHTMYKFLLYTCYEYPVETCNDLLESQGLPVLGKK